MENVLMDVPQFVLGLIGGAFHLVPDDIVAQQPAALIN
jgi:hypothetical protein